MASARAQGLDGEAACLGAAEGLSTIFGPILMTQVFGAFERTMPGAPFFVAAVLSLVALLIALRAPAPTVISEDTPGV